MTGHYGEEGEESEEGSEDDGYDEDDGAEESAGPDEDGDGAPRWGAPHERRSARPHKPSSKLRPVVWGSCLSYPQCSEPMRENWVNQLSPTADHPGRPIPAGHRSDSQCETV